MQLKTILNRVTNYKSFVIGKVNWSENSEQSEQLALEVTMRPRANGRPICSGCGKVRPGYDQADEPRRFEFVPLWGILVVFFYRMRRVNCAACGVKGSLGGWQEPADDRVQVVPCPLGTADVLDRCQKRLLWIGPDRKAKRRFVSFVFSAKPARPSFSSFVATCGRRT